MCIQSISLPASQAFNQSPWRCGEGVVPALSRRRKPQILTLLARFYFVWERNCFSWLAYRTRNIHNITTSAFLLGVKANLFCIDGFIERRIHMACLLISTSAPMNHWSCPVPSQVTWENNLSPLNERRIYHWNDILFYWVIPILSHWYQRTMGLTNRIRLCILDMVRSS